MLRIVHIILLYSYYIIILLRIYYSYVYITLLEYYIIILCTLYYIFNIFLINGKFVKKVENLWKMYLFFIH